MGSNSQQSIVESGIAPNFPQPEQGEDDKGHTARLSASIDADLFAEMKVRCVRRRMTIRRYLEDLIARDIGMTLE